MRASLLAALLIALSTARADAGPISVPDPAHSTFPTAVVFCPGGDISNDVVVRDFIGMPIAGSLVIMDFSACSDHHFCGRPFPDPAIGFVPDGRFNKILGVTKVDGSLPIRVAMGGTCWVGSSTGAVALYADGVALGFNLPLASPDQDGDFEVDDADAAILQAKIDGGAIDKSADLDANGVVDAQDLDVLNAHLGHLCDSSTPARRKTWGELKLLYR